MAKKITISLSTAEQSVLEKRAKKQFMTLDELVQDIIRRSAVSTKSGDTTDNVEDKFLTFFSRKGKGSKRK